MKALGIVVSDNEIFENCILKTNLFCPRDLLMQQITTSWTISLGDHPGTIPVVFGQIPMSGSREEVDWFFLYNSL